jgi:hypothetical protein
MAAIGCMSLLTQRLIILSSQGCDLYQLVVSHLGSSQALGVSRVLVESSDVALLLGNLLAGLL